MKKYLLLFLFAFSLVQVNAQQKASLSLQQCIDYAIKNNLTLQNAKLDKEEAHRKAQEVLGMGLPQINFSGGVSDAFKLPPIIVPGSFFGKSPGTYGTATFGLPVSGSANFSASQLLFDSRYLLGVQAARTLTILQEKNVEKSTVDVIQQVSKSYYLSLVARENLKLLAANITRLEKLTSDVDAAYKQGLAEKIDVNRLTVNLNNIKTQYENVKKLVELSDLTIKFQIGMPVNDPIELTDSINTFKVDQTMVDNERTDVKDRPEYQMLNTMLKLNILDKKSVAGTYIPSLFVTAGYGFEFTYINADIYGTDGNKKHYSWYPYQQGSVGLTLQFGIFDGFQKYRQLQQKNIEILKTTNNIKQFERGAMLEIRSARTNLSNAIANYKSQKSNIELAEEVYRQAKVKYDNGVGSSLEVTNAQTDLLAAENNYLQAWVEALNAQVDLKKALGLLK